MIKKIIAVRIAGTLEDFKSLNINAVAAPVGSNPVSAEISNVEYWDKMISDNQVPVCRSVFVMGDIKPLETFHGTKAISLFNGAKLVSFDKIETTTAKKIAVLHLGKLHIIEK